MHVSVVHDGGGVNVVVSAGGLVDVIATPRRGKHVREIQWLQNHGSILHASTLGNVTPWGDVCREKEYGALTV